MTSRSFKLVGADRLLAAEPKASRRGNASASPATGLPSRRGSGVPSASGAPTTSLPSAIVFRLSAYTMRAAA